MYEQVGRSRTYFVIDADALPSLHVLGYFSISLHSVKLPETLNNRQIQRLDGFSAKNKDGRLTSLPAYLIGQLAKNDEFSGEITGRELLEHAFSIIMRSHISIGGRLVAIDCKPIPQLHRFYKNNGFVQIGHNQATGLDQFVFMLNNKYIKGSVGHKRIRCFEAKSLQPS